MEKRIKNIRNQLDLTQTEFGEMIGLSRAAVASIENCKANPTGTTIAAICAIFDVNKAWLETGIGEPFNKKCSRIDDIVEEFNLTKLERAVLEAYLALPPQKRAVMQSFMEDIVDRIQPVDDIDLILADQIADSLEGEHEEKA